MRKLKKLLVFASGSKTGGGSGFANLCTSTYCGEAIANIVAVVSNHAEGGVRNHAEKLRIPFVHFPAPWDGETYFKIMRESGAEFAALSGWLKQTSGLCGKTTFNIHPAPLPRFGGKGMYGHHAHQAVIEAYRRGEITQSAVTMHFVTNEYDKGPVFFTHPVPIFSGDDADSLGRRVLGVEHFFQPIMTAKVLAGEISWDGVDPASLEGAILK